MPLYRFSDSCPKDKAKVDRRKKTLKLHEGIIVKVDVQGRPGACGTLHCCIGRGLHQVWPTTPEESFTPEANLITSPEYEPVHRADNWWLWTWNSSTANAHEVVLRLTILPKWAAAPYTILKGVVDTLRRLIGV